MSEIKRTTLHCIGDSHTSFFTGYNRIQPEYPKIGYSVCSQILTYRIGAPLAYTLIDKNNSSKSHEKLFSIITELNPNTDIILLSFGEIDCRAHLLKQAVLKNIEIENVVNTCVDRYLKVIHQIKNLGFKLIIWNAIPTAIGSESNNPEYPYYGTEGERDIVTKMFNELLARKSKNEGYLFLNLFHKILNQKASCRQIYYFDKVHLNSKLLPNALKIIKKNFPELHIGYGERLKMRIRYFLYRIHFQKDADKIITRFKKLLPV